MLDGEVPFAWHTVRDHLPVRPLRFLGEPLERVGRLHHFHLRFGDRLALFHGHVAGELVGALADQIRRLLEDLRAVPRRELHPRGHRFRRGFDGPPAIG